MNNHNNEENNEEINRKRKNFHTHFENRCKNLLEEDDDDDELLKLSLMTPFRSTRPRVQPHENIESFSPLILENHESSTLNLPQLAILTPTIKKRELTVRKRRNSLKPKPGNAKEVNIETITPPFPWATNLIATVHTLQYLLSKQLFMISGDVQCKRCERRYTMEFDLKEKFVEIGSYVMKNKTLLKERAPSIWMTPLLPTCQFCKQENSVKPIICANKNKINWLFYILGGCWELYAYFDELKQVDPTGPFHQTDQRKRHNSLKPKPGNAKEVNIETITPPFPWATNLIATVHTLQYLLSKQLFMISGDVQCKRCERRYTMEFDLKEKFVEIGSYVMKNKNLLKERAPSIWMTPLLPTCQFCKQENSVKPIICADKNKINWLFLLLGQMMGCCTLDELKFFCEHIDNHRTGAKDRVLFLAYLTLCRQVDPTGPFYR
ncbi:hypothetical protein H5410_048652 [Solanum commersonii]|uniref:DUF7086 domain-containing protein n=1 Tax=Solanum commersonii TaxID=4109 RepID=A0A9J5XKF3_SOLCO|nr:hypothetical protein H5410_048652 [Solanum commersonii]